MTTKLSKSILKEIVKECIQDVFKDFFKKRKIQYKSIIITIHKTSTSVLVLSISCSARTT